MENQETNIKSTAFSFKNIIKSPVTSIMAVVVFSITIYERFSIEDPSWLNSGVGIAISLILLGAPDKLPQFFKKFFGLLVLGLTLVSCNPVKKVLNNNEYFAEVRDTVFARGLCVVDTKYVETINTEYLLKDTVIYENFALSSNAKNFELDTFLPSHNVHLKISDGQFFLEKMFSIKQKVVTKTETITVEDVSKIKVLNKQLVELSEEKVLIDKALFQAEVEQQEIVKTLWYYKIGIGLFFLLWVFFKFFFRRV